MSKLLHSIRWRVQTWHAVLLLAVILAFCTVAYRLAWDNQLRRVDRAIMQAERELIRSLVESMPASPLTGKVEPFSPTRLLEYLRTARPAVPPTVAAAFRGTEPGYLYFSIRDAEGRVLLQSPNFPPDLTIPALPADGFSDDWRTVGARRETVRRNPEGMSSLFGMDLTPEREEMRRFVWSLGSAGLGVWLLGLVGGWWLAGRAIHPIQVISTAARRITAGNLRERIDTVGSDSELGELGRILNASFDRLNAAVEQQKQFTADASHELKTPLTILLSETQRALKRERSPEEYRAILVTCRTAAERMRHLTEALLLLARQEATGGHGPRDTCDLASLAAETVAQLQPLAAERQLTVHTELPSAPCRGDADALRILLSNLVANALQHHDRPGGCVTVATNTQADGRVTLTLTDDGPGIAPGHLPHIFDRFYRADEARTGGSGHSGLGLAIAKTIADNHAATLVAENNLPRGARFTLSFPPAKTTEV